MKKSRFLIGIILGILAAGGATLLFSLNEQRSFEQEASDEAVSEAEPQEEAENGPEEAEPSEPEAFSAPGSSYEITQEDCVSECEMYGTDPEKLRYCKSVCGLAATEGQEDPVAPGCASGSALERDMCIKNEAVRDKNLSRCEDIQDGNLKKSCQARVTEEYL